MPSTGGPVEAIGSLYVYLYIIPGLSDARRGIKTGEIGARTLVTPIRVDRERNVQLWNMAPPPPWTRSIPFPNFPRLG